MKEDDLQIMVADYLRLQYPNVLWAHIGNERFTHTMINKKTGKRFSPRGQKLKRMGIRAGMPDILIFKNKMHGLSEGVIVYNGLAIELKVKPNKISKNQKETLIRLEGAGWDAHVCFTFEDAKTVIDNYLGGRS